MIAPAGSSAIPLELRPGQVALATWRAIWAAPRARSSSIRRRARRSRRRPTWLRRCWPQDMSSMASTPASGSLARTRIDAARLAELQRALVLSHSAGTGALLAGRSRAARRRAQGLLARARPLGRALGGDRRAASRLHNAAVVPCIPAQGSVGASGDLAPLAHLASVLIGEGVARVGGREVPGRRRAGRGGASRRSRSRPKEGLALLNGTQVSTALALAGLFAAERAFARGARRRRAVGRRVPRQRHAVRRAHPRGARAARAGRRRRDLSRAARRQRDPRVARRLPPRAGPVQPALPAAGDGRMPRPAAPRVARARDRGERRLGQSARVRPTATCCRAATSTRSRSRSRPTTSRSRSPRPARCPSGASR